MKSIRKFIATIVAICAFAIISLGSTTNPTYAAASICTQPNVSDEIKAANGCPSTDIANIEDVIINVINAVVFVLGAVSAVFIIVGGVNYMTSTGDSAKVEKAKKTILYAVIGLVICVLAFAIVNFVVANIIESEPASPPSP